MNDKEIIRHEKYCQLRKEIRGSEDHMIVGIDVEWGTFVQKVLDV